MRQDGRCDRTLCKYGYYYTIIDAACHVLAGGRHQYKDTIYLGCTTTRKEISGSQLPSAVYEKLQLPFGSHFRFHPRPFCVNAPPSSVGKVSGEIRDGSETLDQCDSQLNL